MLIVQNIISIIYILFRAEAERMRMKASAYKQYGDAAILSLVLESLPQVTTWDNSHKKIGIKVKCCVVRCCCCKMQNLKNPPVPSFMVCHYGY